MSFGATCWIFAFAFSFVMYFCTNFRSNLYVDDVLVVNNDYAQSATQRCGVESVTLQAGNHTLYVEGWSRTATLSITATLDGYDSLSNTVVIPGLWQCNPNGPSASSMNFTICGYRADYSLTLGSALDLFTYYNQVRSYTV